MMALIMDQQQQSNFKHFCKICKKGFMCGRALGGHMRAHGIGDEGAHLDDEDPMSDWEDNHGDPVPPGTKRMYALRTNPNRLKSCRVCENCGKEFSSWKSFLEHGKCTSEDVESLVSSHDSEDEDAAAERRGYGWSKRKRSLRVMIDRGNSNCPSSEDEDLANCLMMLSRARVDPSMVEPEESCASASRDEERRKPINFVPAFSHQVPSNNNNIDHKAKGVAKGLFECKACKKVFNSHQALGGHRASHKKVKGCFAARLDAVDDYVPDDDVITHEELILTESTSDLPFDHRPKSLVPSKRKSKVHECSICHRVFSSGQALGGHKRCHWITSNSPDTNSLMKLQNFHDELEQIQQRPKFVDADPLALKLDLNLPAPSEARNLTAGGGGYEVSTEIYLQSWLGLDGKEREKMRSPQQANIVKDCGNNKTDDVHDNNNENAETNVDDKDESKAKIAKLSELKDMNMSGAGPSSWLQVGIGLTTTTTDDHHREGTSK